MSLAECSMVAHSRGNLRKSLHFLEAPRSHVDSWSAQHHVTAAVRQAGSGLRVICCGHGESKNISADSKEHQQSQCIAEVNVCSPTSILTVAGHITQSLVYCRDYPTSAEDYELLEEAGRGVSATVSGHIAKAASVARQAVLGLSPCHRLAALVSCTQYTPNKTVTCTVLQVWRAHCKPLNEYVAVKLLDLENLNCSLVSAWSSGGSQTACAAQSLCTVSPATKS